MSMAGEIENSEHAIKEIQAELQSLVDQAAEWRRKIDKLQFRLGVEQLRLEQLKKASKG
jgi:peptidoglycan hydrolase CwlO-like protein